MGSVDNISAMEFKRYDSSSYQMARDASVWGKPDPSLEDTVNGILKFMYRKGIISVAAREVNALSPTARMSETRIFIEEASIADRNASNASPAREIRSASKLLGRLEPRNSCEILAPSMSDGLMFFPTAHERIEQFVARGWLVVVQLNGAGG